MSLTSSACFWMNSRRGSTFSPISMRNISSAFSASSSCTCSSVRFVRVERRLPQLLGVHLAQALEARDRQALLAQRAHLGDQVAQVRQQPACCRRSPGRSAAAARGRPGAAPAPGRRRQAELAQPLQAAVDRPAPRAAPARRTSPPWPLPLAVAVACPGVSSATTSSRPSCCSLARRNSSTSSGCGTSARGRPAARGTSAGRCRSSRARNAARFRPRRSSDLQRVLQLAQHLHQRRQPVAFQHRGAGVAPLGSAAAARSACVPFRPRSISSRSHLLLRVCTKRTCFFCVTLNSGGRAT